MSAQHYALLSAAVILTACATAQENPHYQHSTKYQGSAPNTVYASNTSSQGSTSVQHSGLNSPAGTVLSRVVHTEDSQAAADTRKVVYEQTTQSGSYSSAGYATTTYNAPAYTRVEAACVEQGLQNTLGCTPTSLAINNQNAAVATPYTGGAQTLYVTSTTTKPVSPTEEAMPDSYGTPGYEAMKNAQTEWSYEAQETPEWEAVENSAPPVGTSVPMTAPFASPLPSPEMRAPKIQEARSPISAPQGEVSFERAMQHQIKEGDTVYSFARGLCSSVEEIKAMNSLDGNFSIRLGDTIRLPASKC